MSWWWNGGMWKQSWPTITPGCVELCIQDFQAISTGCCVQSPPCSTHGETTPQGRFHQPYHTCWVEDFGYCWRNHQVHHGIWLQVIQHCSAVGAAQREVTIWYYGEACKWNLWFVFSMWSCQILQYPLILFYQDVYKTGFPRQLLYDKKRTSDDTGFLDASWYCDETSLQEISEVVLHAFCNEASLWAVLLWARGIG